VLIVLLQLLIRSNPTSLTATTPSATAPVHSEAQRTAINRSTATRTASYVYDNNGNMTAKAEGMGTTQFAWDFENGLTQVSTPSSGSVTYKYDALGRRIQRAPSGGASTNFIYDGQDVVQDLNSDATTVDYMNGPGIDNKISQTSTSGKKGNHALLPGRSPRQRDCAHQQARPPVRANQLR